MKIKVWDGKVVEKTLGKKLGSLRKLKYDHALYFDLSQANEIHPLERLLPTHIVDERILSACKLMSLAAIRKTDKRRPISIRKQGSRFVIVDGSSTFLNALVSGWPDIPCQLREAAAAPSRGKKESGAASPTLETARLAVDRHMEDNRNHYEELLKLVLGVIQKIRENPLKTHIADYYSRARKQGGTQEFKERSKIVLKYYQSLQKDPKFKVEDIIDIVGATVIVYYPDQIDTFVREFAVLADPIGLRLETYRDPATGQESTTKVHRDKGYHATHVKIRSEAVDKRGLRIELQIKTMLHDAWGAKMHDLTYKPMGELDPRLKTLMESFGDSLEAIEVQSQTLRDAIQARVLLMRALTRTARQQLIAKLDEGNVAAAARQSYREVLNKIKSSSDHLIACPALDPKLKEIVESIKALEKIGVAAIERLKLFLFLASFREDRVLDKEVDEAVATWSSENKDATEGVFVTAASLHQTNRVADAITLIRGFLGTEPLDKSTAVLACNLANYIIETNMERPSIDPAARDEVEQLLVRIETLKDELEQSAYLDTKGAFLVVFGDEKDIDEGLRLILEAVASAGPNDSGRGYFELYQSYGWRRKLRL